MTTKDRLHELSTEINALEASVHRVRRLWQGKRGDFSSLTAEERRAISEDIDAATEAIDRLRSRVPTAQDRGLKVELHV